MKERGNKSISVIWKVLFILFFTVAAMIVLARLGNQNETEENVGEPTGKTVLVGEKLDIQIPRREKTEVSLIELETYTQTNISFFPEIIKFFTYFAYDTEKSDNVPPWKDLEDFLQKLRQTGRNMFVSPIGHVNYHNEKRAVVKVNIVWESAGPCRKDVNGICVYGAFGDMGYVDFELESGQKILNWKFKHITDPPNYHPYIQLRESRLADAKEFNLNGLPTLYLDCSYSGRYIYLNQGWFDLAWLKYWKFTVIAEGTQNGVDSFSSIDDTGCWSVSLWLEEGWKGGNLIFNNQREPCFRESLGFMNDHAQSVSCFNLCTDKFQEK